ncbi:hypothetical protein [Parafrankia soli]|uniref:hypothetical protein n=1 Tax=Parafrankia soli TaxID=2599596 RepID=UPI0034D404A0
MRLEFNELPEREETQTDDIGVDENLEDLGGERSKLDRKGRVDGHATGEFGGKLVLEAVDHRRELLETRVPQPEMHDMARFRPRQVVLLECGAELVVVLHPAPEDVFELVLRFADLGDVQDVVERIMLARSPEDTQVRRTRPKLSCDVCDGAIQRLEQRDRELAISRPVQQLDMVKEETVVLGGRAHDLRSSHVSRIVREATDDPR